MLTASRRTASPRPEPRAWWLLAALVAAIPVAPGCDLEECDPLLDPTCTLIDTDASADAGIDVRPDATPDTSVDTRPDTAADTQPELDVVDDDCGALGEGQSRCLSGSTMQQCVGGRIIETACDGDCVANACAEAVRYVKITDLTATLGGQHPGADIDAIELRSGGVSYYAQRVTDSFIDPSSTRADDPEDILGPPDNGASCDLTTGNEHWIALNGGEIVVAFEGNRAIRSGDTIVVYECSGAAVDTFDVAIGISERLEGDWTTIAEEAEGTVTVTVP